MSSGHTEKRRKQNNEKTDFVDFDGSGDCDRRDGQRCRRLLVQANADPGILVNVGGKNIDLKNVNGADVDPIYIDGSVYLPVRAISEAMGYDVSWDGNTKTVMVGQPVIVKSVVANCTSEPYGKAIHSFTFHVNSTQSVMNLTAEDFQCSHFVYDGNEVHKPFDAKALDVSFTQDTITVEVEPFYPDMSYTQEGYWTMTCTKLRI